MLVSFPCTRDASVRKCVCGTHIVRTVCVMCSMCVCVCLWCSLASSGAAIFISLRLSSVKVSSARPENSLDDAEGAANYYNGLRWLPYLSLYLPHSLLASLPACLPVCRSVCASACLFVRLGNFTISFLSFLSKVLYRNLLYLPLLLTLLSHTYTQAHT